MTVYQELQLSSSASRNYISEFKKPKEKLKHVLIFILKVLLNLAFSMGVVMLSGIVFGNENLIAGLVLLFGITTFRFTDLDIRTTHSIPAMFMIFAILAFGPKTANLVPVGCDLCVNFVCIFLIVLLGCHNVNWFNHSVLILGYLLLEYSDVSGFSYVKRLLCLLLAAVLTTLVLYRNRRKTQFQSTFKNLFTDFSLSDSRSRWQIKIAFCVSGAVFVASLLGVTKPVWAGIAAMSVTVPFGDLRTRAVSRIRANVFGDVAFLVAGLIVPVEYMTYLSMVGGATAGFCAKYEAQTTWNAFSALTVAAMSYGVFTSFFYRIVNNFMGAVFALFFGIILEQLFSAINGRVEKTRRKGSEGSDNS